MKSTREEITQAVSSIKPCDQLEKKHIKDALAWIASDAPLFRIEKPDKPPKHLVVYTVLVDPDQSSILLIDHIKAQLWIPPGGHVLPDEHPTDAVKREVREELQRDTTFVRSNETPFFITVTKTVGLTPGHTDVTLWYLVKGSIHEFLSFDRSEFTDVEWWSFDEILASNPTIFDLHMRRFTKKLANYLKP